MDILENIKKNIITTLPGKVSHSKLAPFTGRLNYQIPSDVFEAAVLILLYEKNAKLYFPLITRQSNHPEDKHRGQIALPGGRKDPSDIDTRFTSLRECSEEIGVTCESIQILGALTPLYIPVSYHHVFPFVGFYHEEIKFNLQENEILSIHEIDIFDLFKQDNRKRKKIRTTEGDTMEVPTIQINGLTIWGATAMILEEFSDIALQQ